MLVGTGRAGLAEPGSLRGQVSASGRVPGGEDGKQTWDHESDCQPAFLFGPRVRLPASLSVQKTSVECRLLHPFKGLSVSLSAERGTSGRLVTRVTVPLALEQGSFQSLTHPQTQSGFT